MTKRTLTLCSIVGGLAISAASVFAQAGAGGAGAGGAGAGGIGAGTTGSVTTGSPTNSQGTLPQPNQNGAATTSSGTGSPFSDSATRGGSNMPSNPGGPANRMDNNTNSNPFPGPATGNPNAGARNGINLDSALNRGAGAGIDARTPDQRAAARDTRQEMRQDLRNQRRDDRQANRENDPNRWRFVQHNGEWWYWMPDNYWMYYRNNNWTRFDPYAYEPYSRYSTGYRGTVNNNIPDAAYFYDEYGRRYRRDYSPDRRILRNPDAGVRMGSAIGGAVGGDRGARIGAEIGGAVDGTR